MNGDFHFVLDLNLHGVAFEKGLYRIALKLHKHERFIFMSIFVGTGRQFGYLLMHLIFCARAVRIK
jgi:hypothetical protein